MSDFAGQTIATLDISLAVGGASQGQPIGINSVTNGNYGIELQVMNPPRQQTGSYMMDLTITKNLVDGNIVNENYQNPLNLDDLSTSPYGAGWSIAGLQQITTIQPSEALLTDGNGPPELFTSTNGVNYTGFPDDTSSLTYNSVTQEFTRGYTDGTVVAFNTGGYETSITDRNGNATTYTYTGALLTSITDPVGLVTTLNYNGGQLSSIVDPAGRATQFSITSGDLTSIIDPNGAATQYAYNINNQIVTETNPDLQTAEVAYDQYGRMSRETLYDGTSTVRISPAQEQSVLNYGSVYPTFPPESANAVLVGSVTNADGRTTTVGFDALGNLVTETDPRGGVTSFTYNNREWPIVVQDPMKRSTDYGYDAYGNVTQITQPDGTTETIAYNDNFGVPTQITDFRGLVTTFMLDAHGNILSRTDPDGLSETYTYNSAGRTLTDTNPLGNTTTYTYDLLGDLTAVQEPGAGSPTYHYAYDAAGDVTSVTDPLGDATTYTYDLAGRVLTIQNPVQYAAGKATTFVYNGIGNVTSITDANGDATRYAYNAREELTTITDPLGDVTSYTYDPAGNVVSVTDPLGNKWTYTYDPDNNAITSTDPLGNVTSYAYDLDSEITSATDPNGGVTTYTYNTVGELTTVTVPGQSASKTYTYDADGNVISVVDPNGNQTVYAYDNMNREASMTVYPNGAAEMTTYAYDANGNLTSVTNPLGYVTSYVYDARNELTSQTDPSGGGTTTYSYDLAGRLLSLTDPVGNVTSYTYTTANQVATATNPMGGATSYTYDLAGNETGVANPLGQTIDYAYNADNRLTTETWVNSNGAPFDVITTTYDAAGNVTQVSDNYATYSYTYNKDNEVATVSDAGTPGLPSVTLTYAYDANGNVTSLTDSLGGVVSYTYDARNELLSETLSGTGLSPEAVALAYDAAGRLTSLSRYSNLAETQTVATTTYGYDHANQVTSITDQNASGTTLVSYGYTYDAAGRLTQEAHAWASGASTDTVSFTYTNNNQLTGVTHTNTAFASESFSYDANGNATGAGYTTAAGNEQTASPGYTYTYDKAGNLLTSTQTSTGDVWTYGYDFRGRLTSAVETSSSGTVLESQSFVYDPFDNRIETVSNGVATWTLYAGASPIMDFNGAGALTVRYLQGPTGVLARQSASGVIAWYLADQLGTVGDLIDNSGNIIDHVDFSAFGTVLAETNPSVGDRMMGFAGLERDSVTGLNLAVMRAQNPGTGRWTTQDPLSFAAGDANLYRYVGNGATDGFDPAGMGPVLDPPGLLYNPYGLPETQPLTVYDWRQYKKLYDSGEISWWEWISIGLFPPSDVPTHTIQVQVAYGMCPGPGAFRRGPGGKGGATDIPSWAKGKVPLPGENGKTFARRLLDDKYGPGNYPKGPGTEHNRIKKYGDRHFFW